MSDIRHSDGPVTLGIIGHSRSNFVAEILISSVAKFHILNYALKTVTISAASVLSILGK